MKTLLLSALATLVLLFLTIDAPAADAGSDAGADSKRAKKPRGTLVHVVSFKFKDTAGSAGIRQVEEAFAALPSKIPQIASYEAGTNVSPEKLDKGFTHAFVLTFLSAKDRDDYLVHPDHQAFGKLVGPYVADVFVIDFWARKSPPAKAKANAESKAGAKAKVKAEGEPGAARKAKP